MRKLSLLIGLVFLLGSACSSSDDDKKTDPTPGKDTITQDTLGLDAIEEDDTFVPFEDVLEEDDAFEPVEDLLEEDAPEGEDVYEGEDVWEEDVYEPVDECDLCVDESCADELEACDEEENCWPLFTCMFYCEDDDLDCFTDCDDAFGDGADALMSLFDCIEENCEEICFGEEE